MIESKNTNELQGQYELTDLLPKDEGTGIPDGYDAEGHLLNIDYPPTQKPSPGGASSARETAQCAVSSETGPAGPWTGGSASALTDEVPDNLTPTTSTTSIPQTPAPADRLTTLATEINAISRRSRRSW